VTIDETVAKMRALGIRRVKMGRAADLPGWFTPVEEIELFDLPERIPATEPAPPGEDPLPLPEDEPPGCCVVPGCLAKAGFHFAPAYCEQHGLAEFGVVTK